MEMIKITLAAYLITTVFALGIAAILHLMAKGIKRLNLKDEYDTPASGVPVSPQAQDLTPVAIAIAVANHKASGN
jgi:hypothetical protein